MRINRFFNFQITRQILIRMGADVVIINIAIFSSLIARYLYLVIVENQAKTRPILFRYFFIYRDIGWILTFVCLVVFVLSGLYARSRSYKFRYKILIIVEAVSLSYLLFGFFAYFFSGLLHLPRIALILAWLFTMSLMISSRVGSAILRWIISKDQRIVIPLERREVNKVLVIGGAGYIGSALLSKLLKQGNKVRLLDLLLYGSEPIQNFMGHPRLEIVKADFRQVDKMVEAVRDVDAVIHLGAIVGDPACALDEELTIEVNLMATRMIAEVAKGSGVGRFIFASTCSVYGAGSEILDEYSKLNPVSLYAQSKIASEKVLMQMGDPLFAPTCLRFGTIYGFSGRIRFDLVVNMLTAKAVFDGEITIYGGDQWRPFLHVDDAALAILKTLKAPVPIVRDQVFNVGSNEQNYTISQVGEIVQRFVPTAKLLNLGTNTDKRDYRVDFNKIHNILGFTPWWTLERGIQQVIDAIQNGRVKDHLDAKYSNVKFLSDETNSHLIRNQTRWAYDMINDSVDI